MIIASDQTAARAYADLLRTITGEAPTVVLSDDRGSSDRIPHSRRAPSRWLVAVRMVSEGVDVPRLAVGVYATSASTPLFFAQAIGRFVRSRQPGETASIFLPSVPNLLLLASEMEAQRNHILGKPHRETLEDPLDAELAEQKRDRTRREGQRDRIPGRRRRTRSGDLRWFVVRHRDTRGQRRGGRLPRHPGPAGRHADARPVAAQAGRATDQADASAASVPRPTTHGQLRELRQRAQRPGVGGPSPHRQAARLDPQRAATDLRRPAHRRRDDRSAQGPHRGGPRPHGVTSASSARWASELSRCSTGNGGTRCAPAARPGPLTSHR